MIDSAEFLKNITTRPGVYQMLDGSGKILYVGKAQNLKKRLSSYFRANLDSAKTKALMSHVVKIDVTVTATEQEALLLECQLIKKHHPRYNILLRDDKSYPYIFISDDKFPRIVFHRGAKREKGRYFGPYASVSAVRETLNLLQKLFPVRQCSNQFYRNRSRPCLQYQIKRCLGPCVGLAEVATYKRYVDYAKLFLSGKDSKVIDVLTTQMDQAADALKYEEAAFYRDKISKLRQVQAQQSVSHVRSDADVFAVIYSHGIACVHVMTLRQGKLLANQNYFPKVPQGSALSDIMMAFITQYYLVLERQPNIPSAIIANVDLDDKSCLLDTLSARAKKQVQFFHRVRTERARWLKLAVVNATQALERQLSAEKHMKKRFEALQEALDLAVVPQRIECFDISHTSGDLTVGACVVFDTQGPRKADYRRYSIDTGEGGVVAPSDDYGAMRYVLKRRYQKIKLSEAVLPDILLIDGGKGQLKQATDVLKELNIEHVLMLGISKGEGRKPEFDTLHIPEKPPLKLSPDSEALHLLQHVRDEAHRFAIAGHRGRRAKVSKTSILEEIPGVGAKRRRDLLRYFGGIQGLQKAGVTDIASVSGVSVALAERIYAALHETK